MPALLKGRRFPTADELCCLLAIWNKFSTEDNQTILQSGFSVDERTIVWITPRLQKHNMKKRSTTTTTWRNKTEIWSTCTSKYFYFSCPNHRITHYHTHTHDLQYAVEIKKWDGVKMGTKDRNKIRKWCVVRFFGEAPKDVLGLLSWSVMGVSDEFDDRCSWDNQTNCSRWKRWP